MPARLLCDRCAAKWASCSTAGNLNFNSELLALDRELADYVIVHELLHFSVPNHGKLWKSLMRAHLGDHEKMERRWGGLTRGPFTRLKQKRVCHDRLTHPR